MTAYSVEDFWIAHRSVYTREFQARLSRDANAESPFRVLFAGLDITGIGIEPETLVV